MKKIILFGLVLLMSLNIGVHANNEPEKEVEKYPYPVNIEELSLTSQNYVLMDMKTGEIVGGKNIDKLVHPASITKAITSIVALEMLEGTDLSEIMVVSPAIFPIEKIASIAMLNPDDKFSYDDILYGIALPSGADAANALSYVLTDSKEGLTENMNEFAKRIGMKNTHFVNTTGLDHDDHLTTVYDLALAIRYALDNEDFKRYYTATNHLTAPSRMHPSGINYSDTTLIRAKELGFTQIIGAKSGTTDLAERSVSLLIESDDNQYVYVSTNATKAAPNAVTVTDAMKVVNDLESNYQRFELYLANQSLKDIKVWGLKEPLKMSFTDNKLYYLEADQDPALVRYEFTKTPKIALKGIKKGIQIAELNVYYEDEIIHTQAVEALEDYPLSIGMIITIGLSILVIAIIVLTLLAMIYFAIVRKRNRRLRRRTLRR